MAIFSLLLTIAVFGATAVQLFFWLFVFSRLAWFDQKKHSGLAATDELGKSPSCQQPVSVIICARNEAANLTRNLSSILEQDFPEFEVVVVNDASTDETATILQNFSEKYKHLRVITIAEKRGMGKKNALARGIEGAKYDWVLLTDADCRPFLNDRNKKYNPYWISGMMAGIVNEKQMVLGYAPYEKRDSSFVNKFIRFETVWTATQYLSFALVGQPYMGVGRNLLYNKNLYFQANGFEKHVDLASGDDDLFVNQVITQRNFSLILLPQCFMVSEPKTQWNSYFTQKKRHLSAGNRYTLKHKILLGAVSLSHFLFFVTTFFCLLLKISTMFAVANIIVRTIVIWIVYAKILRKLHEGRLVWWIPILDFSYVFFYLVFAFTFILRAPPQKWQ